MRGAFSARDVSPGTHYILIDDVITTGATHDEVDIRTYARYILKEGTNEEKRELMGCFRSKLKITKGEVTIA
jgi:hypothetical protein